MRPRRPRPPPSVMHLVRTSGNSQSWGIRIKAAEPKAPWGSRCAQSARAGKAGDAALAQNAPKTVPGGRRGAGRAALRAAAGLPESRCAETPRQRDVQRIPQKSRSWLAPARLSQSHRIRGAIQAGTDGRTSPAPQGPPAAPLTRPWALSTNTRTSIHHQCPPEPQCRGGTSGEEQAH